MAILVSSKQPYTRIPQPARLQRVDWTPMLAGEPRPGVLAGDAKVGELMSNRTFAVHVGGWWRARRVVGPDSDTPVAVYTRQYLDPPRDHASLERNGPTHEDALVLAPGVREYAYRTPSERELIMGIARKMAAKAHQNGKRNWRPPMEWDALSYQEIVARSNASLAAWRHGGKGDFVADVDNVDINSGKALFHQPQAPIVPENWDDGIEWSDSVVETPPPVSGMPPSDGGSGAAAVTSPTAAAPETQSENGPTAASSSPGVTDAVTTSAKLQMRLKALTGEDRDISALPRAARRALYQWAQQHGNVSSRHSTVPTERTQPRGVRGSAPTTRLTVGAETPPGVVDVVSNGFTHVAPWRFTARKHRSTMCGLACEGDVCGASPSTCRADLQHVVFHGVQDMPDVDWLAAPVGCLWVFEDGGAIVVGIVGSVFSKGAARFRVLQPTARGAVRVSRIGMVAAGPCRLFSSVDLCKYRIAAARNAASASGLQTTAEAEERIILTVARDKQISFVDLPKFRRAVYADMAPFARRERVEIPTLRTAATRERWKTAVVDAAYHYGEQAITKTPVISSLCAPIGKVYAAASLTCRFYEGLKGAMRQVYLPGADSALLGETYLSTALHTLLDPSSIQLEYMDGAHKLACDTTGTVCFGTTVDLTIDPRHKLRVSMLRAGTCTHRERGATLIGISTGLGYVARGCGHNALNAMVKRHLIVMPETVETFGELLTAVADSREALSQLQEVWLNRQAGGREAWLQRFDMEKRDALLRSTIDDSVEYGRVSLNVKVEVAHKMPTKGRGIQPYKTLATQVAVGPNVDAAQHAYERLFQGWGGDVRVTIACSMSPHALGLWMEGVCERHGERLAFLEWDGEGWDGRMGDHHHDVKYAFYDLINHEFAEQMRQCKKVRGKFFDDTASFEFEADGTTKSGHCDTSLGNSLVNASINYSVFRDVGVEADVIVAGDDALVAFSDFEGAEELLLAAIRRRGVVPKGRVFRGTSSWGNVTFTSKRWVPAKTGLICVPLIGRVLRRQAWSVHPPVKTNNGIARHWYGMALSYEKTCGGLPVLGAYFRGHASHADQGPSRWSKSMSRRMAGLSSGAHVVYDDKVYEHLAQLYDVTAADLAALEERFVGMTKDVLPTLVYRDATIRKIEAVDLADIGDRPDVTFYSAIEGFESFTHSNA